MNARSLLALSLCALGACTDTTTPTETNEGEVITTVELTFAPTGDGPALVYTWDDPENDGNPVIDDIVLASGGTYDLSVRFLNALEDPAEDITEEVDAESDEHQLFFTGTAVDGPAGTGSAAFLTHAYADEDVNGIVVGLDNDIVVDDAGEGTLIVTLRHLPPADDEPVKADDLAATLAAGGFADLPGATDVQVTFSVVAE